MLNALKWKKTIITLLFLQAFAPYLIWFETTSREAAAQLRRRDRLFWVCLSRLWKDWREALIIVKPETVIKWHREVVRLYWRLKSKAPVGRPQIDKEIRELIRRMSRENPFWGAPRIQSELHLLGFNVTERTVVEYRIERANPCASPKSRPTSIFNYFLKPLAARTDDATLRLRRSQSPARTPVAASLLAPAHPYTKINAFLNDGSKTLESHTQKRRSRGRSCGRGWRR